MTDLAEVKMTPAIQMLLEVRKVRTEQEVDEEFHAMQKRKEAGIDVNPRKKAVAAPILDEDELEL